MNKQKRRRWNENTMEKNYVTVLIAFCDCFFSLTSCSFVQKGKHAKIV